MAVLGATAVAASAGTQSAARSPWKIVSRSKSTSFHAIHALSDTDVWVAGDRGRLLEERPFVLHWDGRQLVTLPPLDIGSAGSGYANDVAPITANDVWVAARR
jgi:hypothetical protein